MVDDITASISAVKKWLNNPVSRALLKFVATEDKCGNRLSIAIDHYVGEPVNACWKCKLAGHFVAMGDAKNKSLALVEFIGGCGAGRHYCCIRPNGDIGPCVFMQIKAGNMRKDRLLDVWHNSPVLERLRDRSNLKGHCGVCENKYICGGCRARAYAYYGDLDAPDPGCINNKGYKK
jgi:radical SAM protein with 4Fe4S-binding SPASM domain